MERRVFLSGLAGFFSGWGCRREPRQSVSYDRYGGIREVEGAKTGYFHSQKIGNRWWLVSPEGHGFISKGVNNVVFAGDVAPALGYSPVERNNQQHYQRIQEWAKATAEQLRGWGFNTIGAWSSGELEAEGMPYSLILDCSEVSEPDVWQKGLFPDVYSQEFREDVDKIARRECSGRSSDPWLLGYYTDNELHWERDWRSDESVLTLYLGMPARTPAFRRAQEFLKVRGRSPETATAADSAEFLKSAAAEYFRICADAIRRSDPNHMILGCRFGGPVPGTVLQACGRYVDVVSVNSYGSVAPLQWLQSVAAVTEKPSLVTEFSFRARDSGLPNNKGAGEVVSTQRDRARRFGQYALGLSSEPSCVGFHWFQYYDQPREGRFDGENGNVGMVKTDGTPWSELTETMKEVNLKVDALAAQRGA